MIINAPSFQDYIRKNIISYVNLNTDNTIEISDSKFNLKGDLIISGIILSDVNSDTIIKLESLSTKYIPLMSNLQYDSSLNIDGLKLFINQGDKELEEGFNLIAFFCAWWYITKLLINNIYIIIFIII